MLRKTDAADAACWAFGPAGTEIGVRNAEALLAHLPLFLAGWPFRRAGEEAGLAPQIHVVERAGGGFEIACRATVGGRSVHDGALDAASGLADALVAAWLARNPDLHCLRAGSVCFGRGIVLLLGAPGAGKSSIALQLAAAGYRLFGEDRLALRRATKTPPAGLCLGLTPRLRLPLPADCGPRFAEYVEGFTEMRDAETAWLKLWDGEAAGFAEEAPLAGVAILERVETGACRVAPATAPDVAEALRAGCASPAGGPAVLASEADGIAARVARYRVSFSSSREAAAMLAAALRAG